MVLSADHETIDSAEALFQHLYEAHHVDEARDLDPETAPLQFWLRRHAELEREGRRQGHSTPEPPVPAPAPERQQPPRVFDRDRVQEPRRAPPPPSPSPPRIRPFADPLVEAVAVALAGRRHDERAVRATIAAYGEQRLRSRFLEPLLDDITAELRGSPRTPDRDREHGLERERPRTQPQPQPQPAPPPAPPPRRDSLDGRERGAVDDDFMAIANALQLHRQGRRRRTERRIR
jgi:hypothetical protein